MSTPEARTPTSPGRRFLPLGGWSVAIAATLGMSVSYIDRQTLAAIAPAVRTALAIDHTQFGWLLSAFSMAYLVGAPAAGIVVDRLGARRGFAVAVVVWSVVASAHALVTSFATLFALRILLGAAESPSFPAATQAIRRSLPVAQRSAAYGLLFTGSSLGAMFAAPLAVSLEGRLGFRAAFLVTAALGLLWVPLWLLVTRTEGVAADAADEVAAPTEAVRWIDVASSPPVLRAVVAVLGSAPALMFVLNWSSQYLVEHWHLTRLETRGYLVIPPLLLDVGAVGFGWLAGVRERRRNPSGLGPRGTDRPLFVIASVMALALALAPLAPSPTIATAIFGLAAAGGGGIYVLVTADMLARVPLGKTSAAGGMLAAAQSLAHVIASPLVGLAIDRTHGFAVALLMLGLAVVPASLAFVLWPSVRAR